MLVERSLSPMPESDPRESALARTIGQSPLVARILLARGLDDPDRARSHLRPNLSSLHDPFSFTQMDGAVDRIRDAIRKGETIVVHGDFDVDGISGTVLLTKFFSLMEADVKPFIPHRVDGYSFSQASLNAIVECGAKLCISVDNGTNAVRMIDAIQEAGCDVIVTDHHGTSDNVANSRFLLNPRLPDAGYPDRDLAGVGVAFRLASAIAESFSHGRSMSEEFRTFLVDAMAYVALGTIADVAPLRGENRTMVHHGLRALAVSTNPGIRALLDSAGLTNRTPEADDIAFRIAPLINAAGRMGHAMEAVELLNARGYQDAQEAAKKLEKHNEHRRKVERDLLDTVRPLGEASDDKILVLGGDDWHPGVLGIVSARMAELCERPTILVSFQGEIGRGSGRSPGGIHLREAMRACSNCLRSYGGHAAAAGLEIARDQLDEFRVRINEVAESKLEPHEPIRPEAPAEVAELDPREVRQLDQLGPFGAGNPRPVFATTDAKIVGQPTVDARGTDLRFRIAQHGQLVSARLRGGARHFESIRTLRTPVTLIHSPRLVSRAEEGPIELQVWRIHDAG